MDIPELDNLQREFAKLRSSFDEYIAHPEKLQTIQVNEIKLLGDVFEGLIGAILIDNDFNYDVTKNIVWKMIGKYIEVFTDKNHIKGLGVMSFLKNNNYVNCKIEKISKSTKDGKFQYGLKDRKHTIIEKCYACNEKDAWDIIMEKIEAKSKGVVVEDDDDDEEEAIL
jgi:dsRNA-specific ribonuclease